jgi:hypothetical protein
MRLALAASFAFGLTLGKGQLDDRIAGKKDTPTVTEAVVAPKKQAMRVEDDDFKRTPPPVIEEAQPSVAPALSRRDAGPPLSRPDAGPALTPPVQAESLSHAAYAQLLSTSDQKTAEALAARLIDSGFTSAYVERGTVDKGPVFRVRVKFPSDTEARVAEAKLKGFSKDVWITTR